MKIESVSKKDMEMMAMTLALLESYESLTKGLSSAGINFGGNAYDARLEVYKWLKETGREMVAVNETPKSKKKVKK